MPFCLCTIFRKILALSHQGLTAALLLAALSGVVAGGVPLNPDSCDILSDWRHAGLPGHRCGPVIRLRRLPGSAADCAGHQRTSGLWIMEPCRCVDHLLLQPTVYTVVFVLMNASIMKPSPSSLLGCNQVTFNFLLNESECAAEGSVSGLWSCHCPAACHHCTVSQTAADSSS